MTAPSHPHLLSKPAQLAPLATLPLLVLPWLNPFTSGPNSSVMPYLFTWFCASAVLLWWCAVPQSDAQRLRTVAVGWLVAAGISAVLGLLQYFDVSHDWAPWVNQPGLGQAYGNLRQRNQFATLCSMGVGALYWWAHGLDVGPTHRPVHWRTGAVLALALAGLLGAAIAASGSRTGLLQLVVMAVLVACWMRASHSARVPQAAAGAGGAADAAMRLARWVLPIALLAYAVAALALPRLAGLDSSVLDRLNESSSQCTSRLNLWRNVLYLVAQKPLWGWGWGELDYAHFITLYKAPWAGLRFCEILDNAHNLPLHLAVELGLPLALLLCGALVAWLWHQAPWREVVPERQLAWAVLAVMGVHSLLEYPLWYAQFQAAALLALWLLRRFPGADQRMQMRTDTHTDPSGTGVATAAAPPAQASLAPRRWGRPALLAAAAIASACTAATWSYWRVTQPYLAPDQRAPQYRQQSWAQLRNTWLFSDQVDFAELAVTPVTPQTAPRLLALAEELLHFSPEPMVVQKLLQSAQMLGQDDKVAFYAPRLAAAYPEAYAAWAKGH